MNRIDYRALRCRDPRCQVSSECGLYWVEGEAQVVLFSLRKNWEPHNLFCEHHNRVFDKRPIGFDEEESE